MHFARSSDVVNEDYKRQETESGPLGHTAAKCFPGGNELTDPNTLCHILSFKTVVG